eukprot:755867-Hanusia_phi.AAC.2
MRVFRFSVSGLGPGAAGPGRKQCLTPGHRPGFLRPRSPRGARARATCGLSSLTPRQVLRRLQSKRIAADRAESGDELGTAGP